MKKSVTILGSTGSVGVNTLRVIRHLSSHFEVRGLAARGSSLEDFKSQIEEFSPIAVYIQDENVARELQSLSRRKIRVFTEKEGLKEFTKFLDSDILMAATSGTSSLPVVLDALESGKRVALANKEILVVAGSLLMQAQKVGARHAVPLLIPVDSEHSAIFQCLEGNSRHAVEKLILTGSGGPLREVAPEHFARLTKSVVINHPKWKMGKKISVDSATLMNKGLEIIEASWLFDIPVERIQVLIHPEAVIHSMAQFRDGSVLAQIGKTDMQLPIQYALTYPERLAVEPSLKMDFSRISELTFQEPNRKKFPCLDIAYEAAKKAGSAPCVLSATDEAAVEAYLNDRIHFTEIPDIIEKVLSRHQHVENPNLKEIQAIHDWASEEAKRLCQVR